MPSSFNKKKSSSIIKESLVKKKTLANTIHDNFKVSFQYLDTSQKFGSGFKDWQKIGLLSQLLDVFQGYCSSPLLSQVDGNKFTIYGGFPPKKQTLFEHPTFVPEDAEWARIHITGPAVVVGHIVSDTFYVVFLDKTHKFWLTKKYLANKNI
jgi:hypothetical protein